MVRPSIKSTVKDSSLTVTLRARGSLCSATKELIPSLQELFTMLLNKPAYHIKLPTVKTSGLL